jgi:hypothetical protein
VSKNLARTLAYAADSCAVPLSFVKRTVRTLGKPSWTSALIALAFGAIVQAAKQCVRITARNSATARATALVVRRGCVVVFALTGWPWIRRRSELRLALAADQSAGADQAWNEEPQPQVPDTFGFPNLKPEPCAPST